MCPFNKKRHLANSPICQKSITELTGHFAEKMLYLMAETLINAIVWTPSYQNFNQLKKIKQILIQIFQFFLASDPVLGSCKFPSAERSETLGKVTHWRIDALAKWSVELTQGWRSDAHLKTFVDFLGNTGSYTSMLIK